MSDYDVRFVGDIYSLHVTSLAHNEEDAERFALQNILEEYGWDLEGTYFEVEITELGEYA